jgi:hypothetical protein
VELDLEYYSMRIQDGPMKGQILGHLGARVKSDLDDGHIDIIGPPTGEYRDRYSPEGTLTACKCEIEFGGVSCWTSGLHGPNMCCDSLHSVYRYSFPGLKFKSEHNY